MLFSTPFIRAVRENHPQSHIAMFIVPRCRPIIENNPHIDEIITYDEKGRHKGVLGKFKMVMLLRKKGFDLVFLLHRSFTRTLLCYLAGIPQRIGYFTKKRAFLLTKSIIPSSTQMHKVEYFLDIARSCGMKVKNKDYEFFVSEKDKRALDAMLEEHGLSDNDFFVVINPGGNWELKRWPKENFALLADRLIEEFGCKVIISGAESDLRLAKDIASLMRREPVMLCGKTSLGQLAALMSKANIVVSNDSGPMHIAVSQKARTIALFGPTNPQITGPYGQGDYVVIRKEVGCQTPCYELDCDKNRCMQAIEVDDVFEAAKKIVNAVKK